MTTIDAPTEADADDDAPFGPLPTGRRRRPAPRASAFWRFLFPVLIVAAGVCVFILWRAGTKAVLDSTDGREVDVITDPAEPGYEVFAEPTPTLLVVHHEGPELTGVTAMAQTALERGGAMVLLSPDILVPTEQDGQESAILLQVAYRTGGVDRVRELVEGLFDFGFLEVFEIETELLAGVMQLVEPIPFILADDLLLENDDGGVDAWLDRGRRELNGEDAAQVYGFRNPGEADAGRIERQLELWESWLSEIDRAPDLLAATLSFDTGMAPYLRAFATGTVDISAPPTDALEFEPGVRPAYVFGDAGEEWMAARALEMVPLPVSPLSSSRPSVRLLDGTGDAAILDRVLPAVVRAGAVVSVIGNADEFGIVRSTVAYHRPELIDIAEELAVEFGAAVVFDEDVNEPVDLTVTIGLDTEAG